MTDPRPDYQRPVRWLMVAIVAGAAVNLTGSGLFVWQSIEARRSNCDTVRAAFDAYTDALALATGADRDQVAAFRAAYEPELANCH